jgi:hypothetical protein
MDWRSLMFCALARLKKKPSLGSHNTALFRNVLLSVAPQSSDRSRRVFLRGLAAWASGPRFVGLRGPDPEGSLERRVAETAQVNVLAMAG